ncbi:MAG: hypothetical protein WD067_04840 [Gaiellaceae bacterium]
MIAVTTWPFSTLVGALLYVVKVDPPNWEKSYRPASSFPIRFPVDCHPLAHPVKDGEGPIAMWTTPFRTPSLSVSTPSEIRGEPPPQPSSVTLKSALSVARSGQAMGEVGGKLTPPNPGATEASDRIRAAFPGFPPATIAASPKSACGGAAAMPPPASVSAVANGRHIRSLFI